MAKKIGLILFILCFVFGVAQGKALADTVMFQDNFNLENGGFGVLNYNSFANWNVTDGTVDLIGNGYFDFHPGNGLYVDLDGSTNNAGVLTTKNDFTFLPNIWYRLEFDLGRSQPYGDDNIVTVNVSFAGVVYTITNSDPLSNKYIEFLAVANTFTTPIVFSNAGGDNIGAVLDNVKLLQLTAVPEPTTMLLLGLGLIGLTGIRRKFKN